MNFKQCSLTINPLSEGVSISEFDRYFRLIIRGDKRYIEHVQFMLQPYVAYWIKHLKYPTEQAADIQKLILVKDLTYYHKDPLQAIDDYVFQIELFSSLEEELNYMIIKTLLKFKKIYSAATDLAMAKAFAVRYRKVLRDSILRLLRRTIDKKYHVRNIKDKFHIDIHPDYLYLKNMELTEWESYLFELRSHDLDLYQISDICKIQRETFFYEDKELWKKLNKTSRS